MSDFGEGPRKKGFAVNWVLSENKDNSIIECLIKSYLWGGQTRVRLKLIMIKNHRIKVKQEI